MHTPFTHACPLQDFPQAPQFSGSDANVASQPLAALPSQLPKPALHVKPQVDAAHVGAALGGTGQTVQAGPHAVGSVSPTHLFAHAWSGALHLMPQTSETHVALPPAGTGQAMQSGPHVAGSVLAAHLPEHAWNIGLQVNVQVAAAHAIVALVTGGHLTLQPPQLLTLVWGSTHSAPQFRGAIGVHPFVHWNEPPAGAHSGFAAAHTALQAPQLVAFERSASQPSALLPLQSA